MPNRWLLPTVSIRNFLMRRRRKPETRCMRCRAVSGTKMPLPPSVPSEKNRRTAVGAIGEEQKKAEELEHGYSEDELNKLDAAEAERLRQQREMEELERTLA